VFDICVCLCVVSHATFFNMPYEMKGHHYRPFIFTHHLYRTYLFTVFPVYYFWGHVKMWRW